jgi:O-antigen/teichoic acid export membrane protein
VAITDSRSPAAPAIAALMARIRPIFSGSNEAAKTHRAAVAVFGIRVVGAALAYASQVLLARWMGTSDYGVYVYVWTWVLMLGCVFDFGLSPTSQKLIPMYRAHNDLDRLRGYQSGARWMAIAASIVLCLALAGVVRLMSPRLDPAMIAPLYLGLLTLPAFVAANIQDGMARAYDWMKLALLPAFIVRQGLVIGFTLGAVAMGFGFDATTAMAISAAAVWLAMIAQGLPLGRRLAASVENGRKIYDVKAWLGVSLPMVLVEGFYLLLSYTDILLLQRFRPSDEVGVYFAAVKTLILVSFIHYAIAASSAHRFSELHAAGDRERLSAYLSHAIKLTFWPSLVATIALLAVGRPMLALFGPQFVDGYGLMFVLAIGLVVRAAVGPIERFLNMAGQQKLCALAYALAFAVNVALCLVLIPRFGSYGAAASASLALVFLTALLFGITRSRFGFRISPFGRHRG